MISKMKIHTDVEFHEKIFKEFSSFQIEPTKRPTFSDIVTSLEKICNLLKEDSDDQIKRKRKGENIYSLKNTF